MPSVNLAVLNQRQTPALYADTLANIPAAGYLGRIFWSTDTFAIYRDNGTGWDLFGGPGTGTVTGSGTAGQIAIWSGTSVIGGTGTTGSGSVVLNNSPALTTPSFTSVNVVGGVAAMPTGSGTLTYSSALGSYVPYTGATANLDMGLFTMQAARLGLGQAPNATIPFSISGTVATLAQLENTSTADTLISFRNQTANKWSIGNEYTAGANDFVIKDTVNTINRFIIGANGYGGINFANSTGAIGGFVINNAQPYLQLVLGDITTPTNNAGLYLRGTVLNGISWASGSALGFYGAGGGITERARFFANGHFVINSTSDNGAQFQVAGTSTFSNVINANNTASATLGNFAIAFSGGYTGIREGADLSFNIDVFGSSYVNALKIATTAVATFSSRVNVNNATDNSLFALNVSGTVNGSSPSFTGNTYTVTGNLTQQFYHVFTGAVGQTLTVPTPLGNNSQYLIVNNSANILTVAAYSGTNIITLIGTTNATITLAANARVLLIADGNNKYYQAF